MHFANKSSTSITKYLILNCRLRPQNVLSRPARIQTITLHVLYLIHPLYHFLVNIPTYTVDLIREVNTLVRE